MKRYQVVVAAILLAFPLIATSAQTPWYAGVTGGAASLRPETKNSPFSIDSSVSFGAGVFAGYDYSERFSFELGYNYLGAATLKGANGKTDIGYSALSAGALMYLYGDQTDIAARSGFTGYFRLGINSMNNSSSIPLDREDNVAILAGVGAEWRWREKLSLRAEITSFDGDAQTARFSVLYRPGSSTQTTQQASLPVAAPKFEAVQPARPVENEPVDANAIAESADAQSATIAEDAAAEATNISEDAAELAEEAAELPTQTAELPQETTNEPTNITGDVASQEVTSTPGIVPINTCYAPAANEPIDSQGCALFGGILSDVEFAGGTATLTPDSKAPLDRLSENLLRYQSISIEIQSHTEAFSNEGMSKEIAKQRAITIARHLVGKGVPVKRLRARSFGDSRPLAPDDTEAGRKQNNRIELRVLP